jgi:SAM-dependent MidA family methyltransferase
MTPLPQPSFDDIEHSQRLTQLIKDQLKIAGWLGFADFMHMALYEPSLGYYTAGRQKFGKGGDFVTAPELSPLFAQTLCNQIVEVLPHTKGVILELGAGTGALAVEILRCLDAQKCLPTQYLILEVSSHLRQIQLERLQKDLPSAIVERVSWLSALPASFDGMVIANEVLDAIPVHIIRNTVDGVYERGLALQDDQLVWHDKKLDDASSLSVLAKQQHLPDDYVTEFCPAAAGLINSLGQMLQNGVILMIDYGFSANEYYHPQRNQGTLMCHYQQYAHTDPLMNIGLQDITAHVDFTCIAQAGVDSSLDLQGFCSQAQFLMNCGILDCLSQISPADVTQYAPVASAVQKLLSPAEMGDLFKVIAFSKQFDGALRGFKSGDKTHTL